MTAPSSTGGPRWRAFGASHERKIGAPERFGSREQTAMHPILTVLRLHAPLQTGVFAPGSCAPRRRSRFYFDGQEAPPDLASARPNRNDPKNASLAITGVLRLLGDDCPCSLQIMSCVIARTVMLGRCPPTSSARHGQASRPKLSFGAQGVVMKRPRRSKVQAR